MFDRAQIRVGLLRLPFALRWDAPVLFCATVFQHRIPRQILCSVAIGTLWGAAPAPLRSAESDSPPAANTVAIEALSRLKGMDMEANPALKKAVLKVLESTRRTPAFVQIVQDFKLQSQEGGLIEVIEEHPADSLSAEAARMLLAQKDLGALKKGLAGAQAGAIAQALGNSGDRLAIPLLAALVSDARREVSLRKLAVKGLAQTQEGAAWLLSTAREEKLPDDLRFTATSELNQARWPQIRVEAAKVLPLPPSSNAEPLPPLSELLKRKGDAAKGAEVFRRETTGCIKCHQVLGEGIDFGPALSEIGSKLGKDALYEAILDPSSGISFGYEAWQFELKSGDEVFGLIASETEDEVTVKTQGGLVSKHKKNDIKTRMKMKLSIMPAGLQQAMSPSDLVNLVEYLAELKKK